MRSILLWLLGCATVVGLIVAAISIRLHVRRRPDPSLVSQKLGRFPECPTPIGTFDHAKAVSARRRALKAYRQRMDLEAARSMPAKGRSNVTPIADARRAAK